MSRNRVRGGFSPSTFTWINGYPGSPVTTIFSTPVGVYETMTDTVTSNFKKISRGGGIVNSAMSSTYQSLSCVPCAGSWSHTNGWSEHGSFPATLWDPHPVASYLNDTLALNEAVNQANANVAPSYMSVMVTLAELNLTVEMFRNAGQTANRFYHAVAQAIQTAKGSQKDPRALRKLIERMVDGWLQGRYGWLPAVYDVQGAMKALTTPNSPRMTARGRVSVSDLTSGTTSHAGYAAGVYGTTWMRSKTTTYRSGILYENKKDLTAEYASRLGLSLADALTVPWELKTLSFVVDWFVDIGTWLRAISPKSGVNPLACWTVTECEHTSLIHQPYLTPASNWSGGPDGGGHCYAVNRTRSRTPSATPTLPGSGSGLTLLHSIDAAALSFQRLKGLIGEVTRIRR